MARIARIAGIAVVVLGALAAGSCRKDRDPATPAELKEKIWDKAKWALWKVDATDEQKARFERLLDEMAPDLFELQQQSKALRARFRTALEADPVDAATLDRVREAGTQVFDRYLARLAKASVDAGAILTVEQRRQLVELWRSWQPDD